MSSQTLIKDIPLGFKGGQPSSIVVSDFAFVKDSSRNILVLGASTDNEIVLVDFNDNYRMKTLNLSPGVEESTGGSSRKIEWAVGTDYVWINGGESKEQFIISIAGGIDKAKLERTLTGVPSGNMMFVNNYQRMRDAQMMTDIADGLISASSDGGSGTGTGTGTGTVTSKGEHSGHHESEGNNGTAGLVVGIVALVGVIALAAYTVLLKGPSSSSSVATKTDKDPETKTLGSKIVA